MKFQIQLAFAVALSYLASASSASSFTTASQVAALSSYQYKDRPTPCYVSASKISGILKTIKYTSRMLNKPLLSSAQCHQLTELKTVPVDSRALCSDAHISALQMSLRNVAFKHFDLLSKIQRPSQTELEGLYAGAAKVVSDLEALRVYYGPLTPSPCQGSLFVVFPFDPFLDDLDSAFTSAATRILNPNSDDSE